MLWGTKNIQHDIPQITIIRRNIWTLDMDCSPAGKRGRRFCGRRLNTSKSNIYVRLFMKNLVLKICCHRANAHSWKNFHTWPGLITTPQSSAVIVVDHYTTTLSSHYGWSLHHKAEESLWLIITRTRLSSQCVWSLHAQARVVITVF
jgi:hypothetical protein